MWKIYFCPMLWMLVCHNFLLICLIKWTHIDFFCIFFLNGIMNAYFVNLSTIIMMLLSIFCVVKFSDFGNLTKKYIVTSCHSNIDIGINLYLFIFGISCKYVFLAQNTIFDIRFYSKSYFREKEIQVDEFYCFWNSWIFLNRLVMVVFYNIFYAWFGYLCFFWYVNIVICCCFLKSKINLFVVYVFMNVFVIFGINIFNVVANWSVVKNTSFFYLNIVVFVLFLHFIWFDLRLNAFVLPLFLFEI